MKSVLIHICCAPCSTVPLKRLISEYTASGFFYNPNIYPKSEYDFRIKEFKDYLEDQKIPCYCGNYNCEEWEEAVKDFHDEPEGGKRCEICYRFRLRETAILAKKLKYDYFTTTLSLSPHKKAEIINKTGLEIGKELGICFMEANFKKQNGFKESCEMSQALNMYRQNYCGCRYSIRH
jgi:predicted adenine nucleotide alpha hydrolase (AANH) superfamily ATPase